MSIVTVEIKKISPHPNGAKLKICEVSDGKSTTQVVCGAKNARLGMRTLLAQVGTTTPTGLEIKEAEIRGVPSHGMLCSAKDLGVSGETGVVDLPQEVALGTEHTQIQLDYLSSIPWHQYQEVEAMYEDPQSKLIQVLRDGQEPQSSNPKLLSKTYFHEGQYLYRHFKG